jgi:putative glutamine amidotransferase
VPADPLILSPLLGPELAGPVVETVDGLLLTGGDDMDPSLRRGSSSFARSDRSSAGRVRAGSLPRRPRAAGTDACHLPRQLVNVALGGDLWRDLPSQRPAKSITGEGRENDAATELRWSPRRCSLRP